MSTIAEIPSRTLRVLIVEDESRLRELLLEVIPEMGFPATAVRSAEEALRVMQSDPHEIAILDLQLPSMGGLDFFELVRRDWPETEVIILTGFGDLPTAQQAIRLDVVEFLSKPCHLYDVERALEHARRRRATKLCPLQQDAPTKPIPQNIADEPQSMTLAEAEFDQILAALRNANGNRTHAAAALGISRRTLHYRLADYRARGFLVE